MSKNSNVIIFTQSPVPFTEGKTIGIFKDSEDKIWFHGPDVARLLEYSRASDMYDLVSDQNKGRAKSRTAGGVQDIIQISETGFYEVAIRSQTELGKKLMSFVCNELLPSIRRTGAYLADTMTTDQIVHVVEDQVVDRCISAARGNHKRVGHLVKALLEKNDASAMRKVVIPYIVAALTTKGVKGAKEIFFQRSVEAIEDWGNSKYITQGKVLDIPEHFALLYLLRDLAEGRGDFLAASKAQTVRRLKEKHTTKPA